MMTDMFTIVFIWLSR